MLLHLSEAEPKMSVNNIIAYECGRIYVVSSYPKSLIL